MAENTWLVTALFLYAMAALTAVVMASLGRPCGRFRPVLALLGTALAIHTIAIALRWTRLGHGPYVNMHEVLSSNIWSLHLALLLACLIVPRIRPSLAAVLPLLQVMSLWLLSLTPVDTVKPVTYDTVWLWVHVALGKVFLGSVLVAVGLSIVVLLRQWRGQGAFAVLPSTASLDELAYRFILTAFAFEGLMLVAGAIWAQDAWGRYWAWDPLETWAFVTWLSVAFFLHLRATRKPHPALSAAMVLGIFILAFATLFGMPFVTEAPHQGAI